MAVRRRKKNKLTGLALLAGAVALGVFKGEEIKNLVQKVLPSKF